MEEVQEGGEVQRLEPSPEAPLAAERVGSARTRGARHAEHPHQGHPPGQMLAQRHWLCSALLPSTGALSWEPRHFGIPMVPQRWLCRSASRDAQVSGHPPLGSSKSCPKSAMVLLVPIPLGAVQGQAAHGQVWQLPGLGSTAPKCRREVLVPFFDISGRAC